MSVQAYYDEFWVWKEQLDGLHYPANEEAYVADFLYGLKWDLVGRVYAYKSKPSQLSDAFYRAKFEESMVRIESVLGKSTMVSVEDNVFEELPKPSSIEEMKIHGTSQALDDDDNSKTVPKLIDTEQNSKMINDESTSVDECLISEDKEYYVFEKILRSISAEVTNVGGDWILNRRIIDGLLLQSLNSNVARTFGILFDNQWNSKIVLDVPQHMLVKTNEYESHIIKFISIVPFVFDPGGYYNHNRHLIEWVLVLELNMVMIKHVQLSMKENVKPEMFIYLP